MKYCLSFFQIIGNLGHSGLPKNIHGEIGVKLAIVVGFYLGKCEAGEYIWGFLFYIFVYQIFPTENNRIFNLIHKTTQKKSINSHSKFIFCLC